MDYAKVLCYRLDMIERIKRILKGVPSAMEIYPSRRTVQVVTDPVERLRRPWERTGQAIQRAIGRFEREHAPK